MIQVCLPLNSSSPALGQNSLMHAELKTESELALAKKQSCKIWIADTDTVTKCIPFTTGVRKQIACSAPALQYLYIAF